MVAKSTSPSTRAAITTATTSLMLIALVLGFA
jgi:hypothetical protein